MLSIDRQRVVHIQSRKLVPKNTHMLMTSVHNSVPLDLLSEKDQNQLFIETSLPIAAMDHFLPFLPH